MRKSYLWAGLFTVAIGGWLASPHLLPFLATVSPEAEAAKIEESNPEPRRAPAFKVRAKVFVASSRQSEVRARGTTEASKRIEVRARTQGIVEASPFKQGASVGEGDLLCQIDIAGRTAQLAQAKAALASAERDFQAASKLKKKDLVADSQVMDDAAKLDATKAQLEAIEWEIGWTKIVSPARGVLVDRPAEAGSLLLPGGLCATVSVLDPILVTAQVGERAIPFVREGMTAKAELATGQSVTGKVRFIASAADVSTRTFRVEMEVANPGRDLREGVTAELIAALPPLPAHKLPSSVLGLDDEGRFGVRLLNADNTTTFAPVTLVAQEPGGAWVMGLPARATIVTVGQDYIKDGEPVEAVMDTAEAGS